MNFEQLKQKAVSAWEAQKHEGDDSTADVFAESGILDISEIQILRDQPRILLRNCGKINPESIHHYIAMGGYEGLAAALNLSADAVIEKIHSAGLRGCGGAGFSAAEKLRLGFV